jgi:penicillin-binding protein 2
LNDPNLLPQINRATQGKYSPGSIFKTVVGMALLEKGLDPQREFYVAPNPANPARAIFRVGGQVIHDQAPPGNYDFKKALIHSSNTYFITNGLLMGIDVALQLGKRLHLGQKTGLPTHQENGGSFPSAEWNRAEWPSRRIANFCIGQDPVYVTPLQMAVLAAAIGNGGNVLYPRLVDRVYPSDPALGTDAIVFPSGKKRDQLGVSARTMRILHDAMLADVEDPGGTGKAAHNPDMRICAKTGTAQVQDAKGNLTSHNVWFLSFAPYPQPKYAVVVMVEGGTSGGGDCAPIAGEIYRHIVEWEKHPVSKQIVTRN